MTTAKSKKRVGMTLNELYADLRRTYPASAYPNNRIARYHAVITAITNYYDMGLITASQRQSASVYFNDYIG